MTPIVLTEPTYDDEPVSLERARKHCRLEPDLDTSPPSHEDDEDLLMYIVAARQWCEEHLERTLAPKVLQIGLDAFPHAEILLPRPPVVALEAVVYVDQGNAQQTLGPSSAVIDQFGTLAWAFPAAGTSWPSTSKVVNAARISYRAGYTRENIPKAIVFAMLLLIGHMHENHEAVTVGVTNAIELPLGVVELLRPYRVGLSMA